MATTYTWRQVYVIAGIALILSFAALATAIVTMLQFSNQSVPTDTHGIAPSVPPAHGFSGSIQKNVGTFSTTIGGLLFGSDLGALETAKSPDVTSRLLTSFVDKSN